MDKEFSFLVEKLRNDFSEKAYLAKKKELEEIEKKQRIQKFLDDLKESGLTYQDVIQSKKFKFYEFLYLSNGKTKNSKEKIESVRKWWKQEKNNYPFLVLFGEMGTGKTMIAKKIAYIQFSQRRSVFYIDKKKLDIKLYEFENLNEFLTKMMEVELLVIDDLMTGHKTDYRFSQIYTVLDYRYTQRKLTILTMNEDIRKYRQEKEINDLVLLSDRLNEIGYFVWFDYPSLRSREWVELAKKGDIRTLQKNAKPSFYEI